MNPYKKGVLLLSFLTIFYIFISCLFYFNGFGGLIGGTFFSDFKKIQGVGENVPIALMSGVSFIWLLFGTVYIINNYFANTSTLKKSKSEKDVQDLVAATSENEIKKNSSNNKQIIVNPKIVLYTLGLFIFGGLLFISIINNNFYIEEYSYYRLWEFRISTIIICTIYFFSVYFYHKRKNKTNNNAE